MMSEYEGHKTHKDGSHTPLTKDEAQEIWLAYEKEEKKRAEEMPQAWDATMQVIRAKERLRKLGWSEAGGLRVTAGDSCAVMSLASTGIWSGRLDHELKYVHYAGGVTSPNRVWLKLLDDLTPEERTRMEECDREAADQVEQEIESLIALGEQAS